MSRTGLRWPDAASSLSQASKTRSCFEQIQDMQDCVAWRLILALPAFCGTFHHAARIALTHVYAAAKVEAIEDFGNSSDPKTNFDNSSDPRTDFGNGSEPKTSFGNSLDPKTDFGIPGQTLAIVWITNRFSASGLQPLSSNILSSGGPACCAAACKGVSPCIPAHDG